MRIGRTLAPAAAPMDWGALWSAAAGILSTGDPLLDLEEQIRRRFAMDHVWLVSSGTAALTLILKALKAGSAKRDVIIPAYTCFSVPAAVLHAGLRPVPCDIDAATFDFDPVLLERALGPNTLCVVAHDLFGVPSDIEAIRALCGSRQIAVVEDAAQAMGVEAGGRKLGTRGDVGLFSLGRGKPLTCGGGGIVLTRSRALAGAIDRQYRRLGAPAMTTMWQDWARMVLMTLFIRPQLYWLPAAIPQLRLGETIYPRTIRMERLSPMQAGLFDGWHDRLMAHILLREADALARGSRGTPADGGANGLSRDRSPGARSRARDRAPISHRRPPGCTRRSRALSRGRAHARIAERTWL